MITMDCKYLLEDIPYSEKILINEQKLSTLSELLDQNFLANRRRICKIKLGKGNKLKLKLNDLLFSLLLIPSRFIEGYKVSKSDFVLDTKNPSSVIKKYFDVNIEEFMIEGNYSKEIKNSISPKIGYCLEKIAHHAWNFNYIKGNSINIYDILTLSRKNAEIKELLNFESNENLQYSEIESIVEEKNNRLIELLRSDETDTCLKNMLVACSEKQFQQAFLNISLKPDLYGNVIPSPINSSFLKGMRHSIDFFVNSVGARKALIVNSSHVKTAGYLARKFSLLLIGTDLARTADEKGVEFCNTDKLLKVNILDEKHAAKFSHRYYKLSKKDKEFTSTGNAESAKRLVGKTILLASPITCKFSKEGKICNTCYGKLSILNHLHVGLANIFDLAEAMIQMLLSSKHLLRVTANSVDLPDSMVDFFEVARSNVTATVSSKMTVNEVVESIDGKTYVDSITIEEKGKNPTTVTFDNLADLSLCLSDFALNKLNFQDNSIECKEGDEIFTVVVQNNELSAPLKKLLETIESSNELNKYTLSSLVQELTTLLIDSKIPMNAVGAEMIIRELARNPDNIMQRSAEKDNIEFHRLTNAIMYSPSASVSMSFEQHAKLLETGMMFEKEQESPLDHIF